MSNELYIRRIKGYFIDVFFIAIIAFICGIILALTISFLGHSPTVFDSTKIKMLIFEMPGVQALIAALCSPYLASVLTYWFTVGMLEHLNDGNYLSWGMYLIVLPAFLNYCYHFAFTSSKMQATPGQYISGLKVVSKKGNKPSWTDINCRYFAAIVTCSIPGIFFSVYGNLPYGSSVKHFIDNAFGLLWSVIPVLAIFSIAVFLIRKELPGKWSKLVESAIQRIKIWLWKFVRLATIYDRISPCTVVATSTKLTPKTFVGRSALFSALLIASMIVGAVLNCMFGNRFGEMRNNATSCILEFAHKTNNNEYMQAQEELGDKYNNYFDLRVVSSYDNTLSHYQKAVETARNIYGAHDIITLSMQVELAEVLGYSPRRAAEYSKVATQTLSALQAYHPKNKEVITRMVTLMGYDAYQA